MTGSSRRTAWVASLTIAAATFLVYIPSLFNRFVTWDDYEYIVNNTHIRHFNTAFLKWLLFDFYSSNWHPLTWVSHAVDYSLWGLDPVGHHLTSVLLHGINTFLVVLLVFRLYELGTDTDKRSTISNKGASAESLVTATAAGLLFGMHPLHVESVAWVAERKDLLCALFFLLSVFAYLNFASSLRKDAVPSRLSYRFVRKEYFAVLIFLVLALLSKPMAVSLPFVFLILDWYPLKRSVSVRAIDLFVEKLPFFVLVVASSVITIAAQQSGGSVASFEKVSFVSRLLVGAKALIFYLWKSLWPADLSPYYPYPAEVHAFSPEYLFAVLVVVSITVFSIAIAGRQRIWLSAWAYYLVTLLPVLGLVQVGSQAMADRYTYLPCVGPFIIAGLGVSRLYRYSGNLLKERAMLKAAGVAAAVCIVGMMIFVTQKQIRVWKDGVTLWSYVIKLEPMPKAYSNRAISFLKEGRYEDALRDFSIAISISPAPDYGYFNDRASVYADLGRYDEAFADYAKAISTKPSLPEPYYNRGNLYLKLGRYREAADSYTMALKAAGRPDFSYYNNRGIAYKKLGLLEAAVQDFTEALRLRPDSYEARYNRAAAYLNLGRQTEADADFDIADRIRGAGK